MPWGLLGILLIVCAVMCAVGFYKFVYFLSIGYGFAVAGGGIAIFIMYLINPSATPLWIVLVQTALFIAYGVRLSGFLLVRELKNVSFRKTDVAKDTLKKNDEKKMPVFVLATIWVSVSVLYVAQVSPMLFRYDNGGKDFAEASMNWIAEGVNIVGQGTLLIGAILLHKNGLAEFRLKKAE